MYVKMNMKVGSLLALVKGKTGLIKEVITWLSAFTLNHSLHNIYNVSKEKTYGCIVPLGDRKYGIKGKC